MTVDRAKEEIISRLRSFPPCDFSYPEYEISDAVYANPLEQFAKILTLSGGRVLCCKEEELQVVASELLREFPEGKVCNALRYAKSQKVADWAPLLPGGDVRLEEVQRPHELSKVTVAIVGGDFGVCENGAIWVDPERLPHRALLFLAEHLIVLLPMGELVLNLHQAYKRIDFSTLRTCYFLAGPSKTADIEQNLVIGAQGARTLTAIFVDLEGRQENSV